jgi:putative PIN family toxin of toxin-antitoxin system
MAAPRVVVDSNVLVSALARGGKPAEIVLLAGRGEIEMCLSPFIFDEIARGLSGPKFGWERSRVIEALQALPAEIVDAGAPRLTVSRDPKDDPILECAEAARAGFVVSGDRDLLVLEQHGDIVILRPADFLLRRAGEEVGEKLLESIESGPSTPMAKKDWDDTRREGRKRVASSKPRPKKKP